MKKLFWAVLVVAGLAFTGGLLLGSLTTRARPVITAAPPGTEKVDCGTVFSDNEWSNDDACEGPRLNRAGLMMLAFMIALTALIASVGVLVATGRRGKWSGGRQLTEGDGQPFVASNLDREGR